METRWFQHICSVKSSSGFLFSPSFPYADYIMKLPSITFIDTNRHSLLHILHLLWLLFPKTQGTVTIAQFDILQYDNSIYFSKYFHIQKESPHHESCYLRRQSTALWNHLLHSQGFTGKHFSDLPFFYRKWTFGNNFQFCIQLSLFHYFNGYWSGRKFYKWYYTGRSDQ